jgi:hypothetical protein
MKREYRMSFEAEKKAIEMRKGNVLETVSNNINNEVKGLISNYYSRAHAWITIGE